MAISNNSRGMQPGVCTSTTRPTNPYEGFMIYETDTDMVAIWNGTAWRYMAATTTTSGTVLQTVSTQYATEFVCNSSTYVDMGLTLDITTKSASSKILAIATIPTYKNAVSTQNASQLRLLRNGTVVKTTGLINYTDSLLQVRTVFADNHLDSPATLGTLTYKYQLGNYANGGATVTCANNQPATLTLMEIAG